MQTFKMLKDARRAAGLTQRRLAELAGTAQPAVAAYESGTRAPTVATLTRLLDACEHDLEITARPRVRRGALSLAQLAGAVRNDLADGAEHDAIRLLFGFTDDFRASPRAGRIALIEDEPPLTSDTRFDAALAGLAEHFTREGMLCTPDWVDCPTRFVEPWWFISSRPSFDAYTLAHTPISFARHGVFLAREVFDRA